MKPSKGPIGPSIYWHPNFRQAETLPDIKVIRTSFAVNAVAVALVLAVGAFLYMRESATAEVRTQAAEWQQRIATITPRYETVTKLQKEFSGGEKKVREFQAHLAPRIVVSDFLVVIAETLPRLLTIDSIVLNKDSVRLLGTVVGASERSGPLAKNYADMLAAHPALKAQMESIKLSNQDRDVPGDRYTFDIELRLKTETVAPAAVEPKPAPQPQQPNNDE